MVKINSAKQVDKISLSRIKKTGGKSNESFSVSTEESADIHQAKNASVLQPAQQLLSLQEVSSQRTAKQHGDKILDLLDQYRIALASGQFDTHSLKELLGYLGEQRESFNDPKAHEIILEIEQRAKIELAKRGLI